MCKTLQNSAKLDFLKFCQTLANVQKRRPRLKSRAKLCAKLPEKLCKTQFFKILPNVSKCSETPSAFKISFKTICKARRNSAKLDFSKFCQTLANVQKRLPRLKFRAKLFQMFVLANKLLKSLIRVLRSIHKYSTHSSVQC